jgi:hypothetical protein
MTGRLGLVISARNDRIGQLGALPDAPQRLSAVLFDPALGACKPWRAGKGFVADPDARELDDAIESAFAAANEDEATLVVAFCGHATLDDRHLLLIPSDLNNVESADSKTAFDLGERIRELLRRCPLVDGLILLVDACYAGAVLPESAGEWIGNAQKTERRFSVLASAAETPAWDACFTLKLAETLTEGNPGYGDRILCEHAKAAIDDRCKHKGQVAQTLAFDGRRETDRGDEGLWLSQNLGLRRHDSPLAHTPEYARAEQLTRHFEPTSLQKLVGEILYSPQRVVVLEGPAGSGKSTLVSALVRPVELGLENVVPTRAVNALVFLGAQSTADTIATSVADQLAATVPEFVPAAAEETAAVAADQIEEVLIQPLHRLGLTNQRRVRIVFDGVDLVPAASATQVSRLLARLADDDSLEFVHMILTTRPASSVAIPPEAIRVAVSEMHDDARRYLDGRGLSREFHGPLIEVAERNWLRLSIAADIALIAMVPSSVDRVTFDDLYDSAVRHLAREPERTDPLLAVLAVVGSGPVLPISLLVEASGRLGGPLELPQVRDALAALGPLVVRGAPGATEERVGLHHQLFAQYLRRRLADLITQARWQLCQLLAPQLNPSAEELTETLDLAFVVVGGGDDPRLAARLYRDLAPVAARVLGADHSATLATRHNLALWVGESGDPALASDLFARLLPDMQRVLGDDHPETLATRNDLAEYTGEAGNPAGARKLFAGLLPQVERVLGVDHPDALTTRNNFAEYTGEAGDLAAAHDLFASLLADRERILGVDHPDTLATRHHLALWVGAAGDPAAARDLFVSLLPDRERVLGADHPDTLTTRNDLAEYTGEAGDPAGARDLLTDLLPDMGRVLGADHPDSLASTNNLAHWVGKAGDPAGARDLFLNLVPRMKRALGADHPATLGTRNNFALWVGTAGDPAGARDLFANLLPDVERVLGAMHPSTLATRHNLAAWVGEAGDPAGARELFICLLPDRERVLGADHPETLASRNKHALCVGEAGEAARARDLFASLLLDRERVLGANHPDTLTTRNKHARCVGEAGDPARARDLLVLLLPDMERILGVDHPDTLAARHNLERWSSGK